MNLITSSNNSCVAASLAMLFDCSIDIIKSELFSSLLYPFPAPWSHLPKVPDMNVICDWAWNNRRVALVPFEYNPYCSPAADCPPIPVWPESGDVEKAFSRALGYGAGLLEGLVDEKRGHMCAWSGNVVHDPRGYSYSRNVAKSKFGFHIIRFWLAVQRGAAII